MVIDDELAAFIESPVMIILGAPDRTGRPDIARGLGVRADRPAGRFDLVFSAWQWPETAANLRSAGLVAVTFSRPADYRSFQLKGRVEDLRDAGPADHAMAVRYIGEITRALVAQGMDPFVFEPWQCDRDLAVVRIDPIEAFVQTPGPEAGRRRSVA